MSKNINKNDVKAFVVKKLTSMAATAKAVASYDSELDGTYSDMSDIIADKPDVKHFLELFPDIVTAAEIMTAVAFTPKDFATVDITFSVSSDRIPAALIPDITKQIKDTMIKEYKLPKLLLEASKHALIGNGAVVKVIIPEGVIDKLMFSDNITTESINNLLSTNEFSSNFLSNDKKPNVSKLSKEDLTNHKLITEYIDITDSPYVLRLPDIHDAKMTTETLGGMYDHLGKKDKLTEAQVMHLSNNYRNRLDVDKPLVINVHPRACKNISVPGDPSKHIAHIILLDERGYPVSELPKYQSKEELEKKLRDSGVVRNTIAHNAKSNINKATADESTKSVDAFDNYLSGVIAHRLKDNAFVLGEDIDIDVISQTALARALARKKTKILILPSSMVSYFAQSYDDKGNGVNKIEKLSILCSMRGLLLFSALGNSVANNSESMKVVTNLDEESADPDGIIKKVKRGVMNMNESKLPIGISSPKDFIKWQQRTGITFVFKGHKNLPKTEVNIERNSRDRVSETDTKLLEDIRKQLLLAIGPGPEIVDNGFDANLIADGEANRVYLGKKAESHKVPIMTIATDFTKKIMLAHGPFYIALRESLSNNKVFIKAYDKEFKDTDLTIDMYTRETILELISSIEVTIPEGAISTKASDLSNELNDFSDWLDKALPAWISEDMLDAGIVGDDASNALRTIIEAYKAYFIRDFINKNKSLVDLDDIVKQDNLGEPVLDIVDQIARHNMVVGTNIAKLFNDGKDNASDVQKKIDKSGGGTEDPNTIDNPIDNTIDNPEDPNPIDNPEDNADF